MNFFRTIWKDIRSGENLDLYATIIVSFSFSVLSFTPGLKVQELSLILPILTLLLVTSLVNRHKVEEISKKVSPQNIFKDKFPETLDEDIEKSRDLLIVGLNLGRTIPNYLNTITEKVHNGDRVRVLVVSPYGVACRLSAMRAFSPILDEETFRGKILDTLNQCLGIKRECGDLFDVRVIDYPLAFGGYLIDSDSPRGKIYVEHYSFKVKGQKPKYMLRSSDTEWFEYYKKQFDELWAFATEYNQISPSSL